MRSRKNRDRLCQQSAGPPLRSNPTGSFLNLRDQPAIRPSSRTGAQVSRAPPASPQKPGSSRAGRGSLPVSSLRPPVSGRRPAAGDISLGSAKAFTLSDDKTLTLSILDQVKGQAVSESAIMNALHPDAIKASEGRAPCPATGPAGATRRRYGQRPSPCEWLAD